MDKGTDRLILEVVPDSGAGELEGLLVKWQFELNRVFIIMTLNTN